MVSGEPVSVKCNVDRSLRKLRTDRAKVKQILMNLISNALKFTAEGSVTISARHVKKERALWVQVSDTGIGIREGDQETVFQDFRQVDKLADEAIRRQRPRSCDLPAARHVLCDDIRVASAVGNGSTFTLVLPVRGRE